MTELIKMWHGGKFDEYETISIKSTRTGKAQNGPGIYTTNDLNTANDYAKGSRSIYYMGIDPNMNLLEKSTIKYDDAVAFVKNSYGLKKKKDILNDLEENRNRYEKTDINNNDLISANVLLNLMVNYDVCKGEHGVNLTKFYVDNKIDASIMNGSNSGEGWILIFNPEIIKERKMFSKKELNENWNSWTFENPTNQISRIEFDKKQEKIPDAIYMKDLPVELKNELYSRHLEDIDSTSIKNIFEMKKINTKIIDLTKISESDLNHESSYELSKRFEKMKNVDNHIGLVANGKLISPLKDIQALIKNGIKEYKVVDVSGIVNPSENDMVINFKETAKKNKILKTIKI